VALMATVTLGNRAVYPMVTVSAYDKWRSHGRLGLTVDYASNKRNYQTVGKIPVVVVIIGAHNNRHLFP